LAAYPSDAGVTKAGAFVKFQLDSHGCLRALFWDTKEEVEAYQAYGDVIIQHNF
jgi:hypothetical protein